VDPKLEKQDAITENENPRSLETTLELSEAKPQSDIPAQFFGPEAPPSELTISDIYQSLDKNIEDTNFSALSVPGIELFEQALDKLKAIDYGKHAVTSKYYGKKALEQSKIAAKNLGSFGIELARQRIQGAVKDARGLFNAAYWLAGKINEFRQSSGKFNPDRLIESGEIESALKLPPQQPLTPEEVAELRTEIPLPEQKEKLIGELQQPLNPSELRKLQQELNEPPQQKDIADSISDPEIDSLIPDYNVQGSGSRGGCSSGYADVTYFRILQ